MFPGVLGRECCRRSLISQYNIGATRQFNSTEVLFLKKPPKRKVIGKKVLAAKARRKALKAPKRAYDSEKMKLSDAIGVLRAVEVTSPSSTIELVIKTAMPRGTAVPRGRISWPREPKTQAEDRILVFADGRQVEEARQAGAHIVGGLELIDGILSGEHKATAILCTPSFLRAIASRLGRVLGPRGLMPSEKRGTVTEDFAGYMRRLKGSVEWKGDQNGTVRAAVAKVSWPIEDVVRNIRYFLSLVKKMTGNERDPEAEALRKTRPVNSFTRVILSSTQGPGIQISDP